MMSQRHSTDLFLRISVLQAKFLLARRFTKINMSLEGKCGWEMDNLGCPRAFDVQE